MLLALIYGLFSFPYKAVISVPLRQHLVLGSTIVLFLVWNMAANLQGHFFQLHLFAVTVVVMVIGVSPTLLSAALALLLKHLLVAEIGWSAFAVNYVLGLMLPILFSAAVIKAIGSLPQKNLFAYMLGCGFIGAIVARLLTSAVVYYLLIFSGNSQLNLMAGEYLPWMLIIAFPEGFINGTIISCITVFYPHWVRSFDEHRYLDD